MLKQILLSLPETDKSACAKIMYHSLAVDINTIRQLDNKNQGPVLIIISMAFLFTDA